MPNRVLREQINNSDRVNKLTPEGEVFYRRLISAVDDYGRFDARPSILLATLYPLKLKELNERDIMGWLDECQHNTLIRIYIVEGKHFLELFNLRPIRQAKKSKYPEPPAGDRAVPLDLSALAGTNGHAKKKKKAEEEKTPLSSGFMKFWSVWPNHFRKTTPEVAASRWNSMKLEARTNEICGKVEDWKLSNSWIQQQGQFIPAPEVWLNKRQFDAPSPPPMAGQMDLYADSNFTIKDLAEHLGLPVDDPKVAEAWNAEPKNM
jgi:hypothetical protein